MHFERDHACDTKMKEGDELLRIDVKETWRSVTSKGMTKTTEFWCGKCGKVHMIIRNLTVKM